jgi:RNA polymerase sigma-70 factor (ECF subfamily)
MTVSEYNTCVDDFSDGVYRFILKNIKDDERSKDIVQESFVRLWDKRATVVYAKARSYIFTTAYHILIDEVRKNKYNTAYSTHYDNVLTVENQYSDLQEILNEALEKLPVIQRTVILLRDYEGYSYQEIGEICELNESQVKVYIFRARVFLKQYIGSLDRVI